MVNHMKPVNLRIMEGGKGAKVKGILSIKYLHQDFEGMPIDQPHALHKRGCSSLDETSGIEWIGAYMGKCSNKKYCKNTSLMKQFVGN